MPPPNAQLSRAALSFESWYRSAKLPSTACDQLKPCWNKATAASAAGTFVVVIVTERILDR